MRHVTSLLALALVGCGPAPSAGNQQVNLIAVLPMTGSYAANGETHRAAIQMAIDAIDRAGGIPGHTIRVSVVDPGDSPTDAEARVEAEVAKWTLPSGAVDVAAILSSTAAAQAAATRVALRARVPHLEVSSGSGIDEIALDATMDPSLELAPRPTCHHEAMLTAQFIGGKPYARLAVLRGPEAHDQMHTDTIRAELATGFPTVVVSPDLVMPTEGPYDDFIRQAMAQAPDAIFFHLRGDTYNVSFLRALKRLGFTRDIVTCGMARKTSLLSVVDPGLVDYLGGRTYFAMRGPVWGENLTRFKDAYRAFSGLSADTFSPSAYDSALLVALAAATAPDGDGATIRDAILSTSSGGTPVQFDDVGTALSLLAQGADVDYTGASGTMDFRDDHTVAGQFYIERVDFDAATQVGAFTVLSSPTLVE